MYLTIPSTFTGNLIGAINTICKHPIVGLVLLTEDNKAAEQQAAEGESRND